MEGRGLICAEGRLWETQRKFVSKFMRESGMSEATGKGDGGNDAEAAATASRRMEARIIRHARDFMDGMQR